MKEIKSFLSIGLATLLICWSSYVIYEKIHKEYEGLGVVTDTNYGKFLASQHALYINDFDSAQKFISDVNVDNSYVKNVKNMASFFNGQMPENADSLKGAKEISSRLIYDAYLIQNDKNVLSVLKENGDFRSRECIELLKEADIVVTNPPFSLFREYVAQLMAYEKKFIIIGNMNAITYKEIFPLIKNNQLWLGPSITSGDRKFWVPDDYELRAAGCGIDETGRKFIRVKGVRWFTNLDHKKRHEELILYQTFSPEEYLEYDNYDAIEVSKTSDIPIDYNGIMGVPITFLDKYNPEQFTIIGITENNPSLQKYWKKGCAKYDRPYLKGKRMYPRLLIRKKK